MPCRFSLQGITYLYNQISFFSYSPKCSLQIYFCWSTNCFFQICMVNYQAGWSSFRLLKQSISQLCSLSCERRERWKALKNFLSGPCLERQKNSSMPPVFIWPSSLGVPPTQPHSRPAPGHSSMPAVSPPKVSPTPRLMFALENHQPLC